jgi:hypothetical protein
MESRAGLEGALEKEAGICEGHKKCHTDHGRDIPVLCIMILRNRVHPMLLFAIVSHIVSLKPRMPSIS